MPLTRAHGAILPASTPTLRTTTFRPLLRAAVTAALVLIAVLIGAGDASAHADLVGSSPANGAVLAAEPAEITLDYSEAVTVRLSAIVVIAPDGRHVTAGPVHAGASGQESLTVALTPDPSQGTYVVDWQATAADDGHGTSGFVTFSVGTRSGFTAPGSLGHRNGLTDALVDVALWLGFAGLAAMVGDAAIRILSETQRPRRWIAPLGWAATLAATLLQLLLAGPYAEGDAPPRAFDRTLLSAALGTPEGHALMARLVLLAVIATLSTSLTASRANRWLCAVLTLALAATWSAASHAASGSQAPLALTVTTVHVAAMALWVGGLGALILRLDTGAEDVAALDQMALCRRFSRLALAAVTALAATGLYQAWREVGGLSALTGTTYGRLLIVKVLIVAGVVTAAARSRTLVARRRVDRLPSLRTSVLIELTGVAVVLAVTVLLLGTDPARDAATALAQARR